jgi:TolB protein
MDATPEKPSKEPDLSSGEGIDINSLREAVSRPRRRHRGGWSLRVTTGGIIILLVLDFIVVGMLVLPLIVRLNALAQAPTDTGPAPSLTASLPPSQTPTLEPPTPLPSPTTTLPPPFPGTLAVHAQGMVVLSLQEGLHSHIFAYQPQSLPLTRLTGGAWDDISPGLSQDGKRLAFASNRNGYWDLYMLELATGELTRLTDSLAYEGAPSLSPDGLWMAYEAYTADQPGGLDIYIRQVSGGDEPIRLTDSPGADYSPVWSPLGRQIAFVSDRSGAPQVWLADLDKAGDQRFRNLSDDALSRDGHPAWSPDGHFLAWSAVKAGYHALMVMQVGTGDQPDQLPHTVGSGDWPAWSPDGRMLLASLLEPNQAYLEAYPLDAAGIIYPPMRLPGPVSGLAWSSASLPSALPAGFQQAAKVTPAALYAPVISPVPGMPGGRQQVVALDKDVEAPYPKLNDLVDESFKALRAQAALSAGWDLLATLENAYIPLTSSLDPGMEQDWLYTGRAFAFTPLPINAGWIVVTREDFGQDTYWRVFLKARFQDGSAGMPLHTQPWDFSARYTGDPHSYEQGGALANEIPAGYWLDFTQIAAAYDWQRLPALLTWRSSYQEARFNEFVLTEGMSWEKAMLELYPPEVMITPTPLVPPTRTLTPTPRWFQSPTPSVTATFRPTWTPYTPEPATPTETPTPTQTVPPTGTSTLPPAATQSPTPTPAATTLSPSPTRTP